jgi:hypothetical protein
MKFEDKRRVRKETRGGIAVMRVDWKMCTLIAAKLFVLRISSISPTKNRNEAQEKFENATDVRLWEINGTAPSL